MATTPDFTNLDPQVVTLARAIRQTESNNNYNATGDNGTSIGAYQWHDANGGNGMAHFQSEAKQFGLDPNDFSPVNQDKVAYAQMKAWKDAGYHAGDIAAMWNGARSVNGRMVANSPNYITKVQSAISQVENKPVANLHPFSSGAVDLTTPNAANVSSNVGGGIVNAVGNFGEGVLKGTSQAFNKVAAPIANVIEKGLGQNTNKPNPVDVFNTPQGTAQNAGAFVGRDVLPATAAATTGLAGIEGMFPGSVSQTLPNLFKSMLSPKTKLGKAALLLGTDALGHQLTKTKVGSAIVNNIPLLKLIFEGSGG